MGDHSTTSLRRFTYFWMVDGIGSTRITYRNWHWKVGIVRKFVLHLYYPCIVCTNDSKQIMNSQLVYALWSFWRVFDFSVLLNSSAQWFWFHFPFRWAFVGILIIGSITVELSLNELKFNGRQKKAPIIAEIFLPSICDFLVSFVLEEMDSNGIFQTMKPIY